MSIDIKELADGQLGSTSAALYTVAASTTALIKSISLVNTSDADVDVHLYKRGSGGTSRSIIPHNLTLEPEAGLILEDNITLVAAGAIYGYASVASVIDYVISGVEES